MVTNNRHTRSVHFIGVGYKPEPVTDIWRSNLPFDRIYLLWNEDKDGKITESKNTIVKKLSSLYHDDEIIPIKVDAFDYENILDTVLNTAIREKEDSMAKGYNVDFYCNITHGTRLMTGALCTAASFLKAVTYYFKEGDPGSSESTNDRIIRINTARIPDAERLTGRRREFLREVCSDENGKTVSELALKFDSKQNVNQYVAFFVENNLMTKEKDKRFTRIKATNDGRMVNNWLMDPLQPLKKHRTPS